MPRPPLPQPVVVSRARPPRSAHTPLSAEHHQWKVLLTAATQGYPTPVQNPWTTPKATQAPTPERPRSGKVEATHALPTKTSSGKVEAIEKPPQMQIPKSPSKEETVAESERNSRRSRCHVSTLSVIAPGAGTGANGRVFEDLSRSGKFRVEIVGHSRASYDRYPESWPQGSSAPNLCTFTQEVLSADALKHTDCLVLGFERRSSCSSRALERPRQLDTAHRRDQRRLRYETSRCLHLAH